VGIIETSCCIFLARPLWWAEYDSSTVLFRIAAGGRMTTRPRTCARCGAPFACAMGAGAGPCWCMDLPPVVPVPQADAPAAGCWCRACLEQHIAQSATAAPATPRPGLSPDLPAELPPELP
jgi:hypothetical protein